MASPQPPRAFETVHSVGEEWAQAIEAIYWTGPGSHWPPCHQAGGEGGQLSSVTCPSPELDHSPDFIQAFPGLGSVAQPSTWAHPPRVLRPLPTHSNICPADMWVPVGASPVCLPTVLDPQAAHPSKALPNCIRVQKLRGSGWRPGAPAVVDQRLEVRGRGSQHPLRRQHYRSGNRGAQTQTA